MLECAESLGFECHIAVESTEEIQQYIIDLAARYKKCHLYAYNLAQEKMILKNIDVIVYPDQWNRSLAQAAQKMGIVPIVEEGMGFENFDPESESGNGFVYENEGFWSAVSALLRASENFKFSYDWRNIRKNIQAMS